MHTTLQYYVEIAIKSGIYEPKFNKKRVLHEKEAPDNFFHEGKTNKVIRED